MLQSCCALYSQTHYIQNKQHNKDVVGTQPGEFLVHQILNEASRVVQITSRIRMEMSFC